MFVHWFWLHVQSWSKQRVEIICFSIDCGMPDPLFTHLWTLSTTFELMQVKTGFDTTILNYILPFFPKVKWYQLFVINTVNLLLKTFHFQRLMLWEYIEIIFKSRFRVFYWLFLLFLVLWWKIAYLFLKKTYCLPETRSFV